MSDRDQAINSYRNTQVNTGDVGNLIVLLYEGAITHMQLSTEYFGNYKKYDVLSNHLKKSQELIEELLCSLDMSVSDDLPKRLQSIYMYILTKIRHVDMKTGKKEISECIVLLEELLSAWKQVYTSSKEISNRGIPDRLIKRGFLSGILLLSNFYF